MNQRARGSDANSRSEVTGEPTRKKREKSLMCFACFISVLFEKSRLNKPSPYTRQRRVAFLAEYDVSPSSQNPLSVVSLIHNSS